MPRRAFRQDQSEVAPRDQPPVIPTGRWLSRTVSMPATGLRQGRQIPLTQGMRSGEVSQTRGRSNGRSVCRSAPAVTREVGFAATLGPLTGGFADENTGFGDLTITPMIGWSEGKSHWLVAASVFLPSGQYEPGTVSAATGVQVPNFGRNRRDRKPAGRGPFAGTAGQLFDRGRGYEGIVQGEACPRVRGETDVRERPALAGRDLRLPGRGRDDPGPSLTPRAPGSRACRHGWRG